MPTQRSGKWKTTTNRGLVALVLAVLGAWALVLGVDRLLGLGSERPQRPILSSSTTTWSWINVSIFLPEHTHSS